MSNQVTSHPLPVLVLVSCLVLMAGTAKIKAPSSKKWINCTRYVFHPACRGIAAKRSSLASFSSPSSPSSSSSSSSSPSLSSSSSSRLFRPLPDDLDKTDLLNRLVLSANTNADRLDDFSVSGVVAPSSSLHHQQQQLQQQQKHRHPVFPYDKDAEWRRQLLRVLLLDLGTKDSDPRESYGFYPGLDDDDNDST